MLAKMSLCSAEEDGGSLDVEDELHSPTDVSEDSVEVRVNPIVIPAAKASALAKAKRKHQPEDGRGPRHGPEHGAEHDPGHGPGADKCSVLSPSPKRRRPSSPLSPFRPWSIPTSTPTSTPRPTPVTTPVAVPALIAVPVARRATAPQEEPLALVKTRVSTASPTVLVIPRSPRGARRDARLDAVPAAAAKPTTQSAASRFSVESIIGDVMVASAAASAAAAPKPPSRHPQDNGELVGVSAASVASAASGSRVSTGALSVGGGGGGGQQRNYKNMTRERRIEANARERTRVHTISAAFDTLRRSVPAYSHSQKLSKLSVLRIACSYILTLSRVAGMDYSEDQSSPAVEECVDQVTRTIQTEGKLRRRRDE